MRKSSSNKKVEKKERKKVKPPPPVKIFLPESDAAKIAGRPVRPSPAESFFVEAEVLGDRQDRVGQSLVQRLFEGIHHIVRAFPIETLVVINPVAGVRRRDGCKRKNKETGDDDPSSTAAACRPSHFHPHPLLAILEKQMRSLITTYIADSR